ncbi:aldo/keto reductase family protein [Kribbella sp. VKM Ac-2571]|nr:aldo/keto reductase [Kribbella sp. VKM Ac-2571]TDO69430.1 aldo/keto reductase family protein [Kribbella sp. VKM Ac-2571]
MTFGNETDETEPTGDGPNDVGTSRRHLRKALEASLQRLGVDHIDLYQLHAWDPVTPLEETLSFLEDAVRAGKISYGGLFAPDPGGDRETRRGQRPGRGRLPVRRTRHGPTRATDRRRTFLRESSGS